MRDYAELCGKVRSEMQGLFLLAKYAQKCGISGISSQQASPEDELCGKVRVEGVKERTEICAKMRKILQAFKREYSRFRRRSAVHAIKKR